MSNEIDLDEIERTEGGKGLRSRLEESLKESRALSSELATLRAEKAIGEQGWKHVKPEDLKGVDGSKVEEIGSALESERETSRLEAARAVLAERGFDPDAVLSAEPAEQSVWGQVAGLGGQPPSNRPDFGNLTGAAKIEAALAAAEKK